MNQNKKILVIDDDDHVAKTIKRFLEPKGFHCTITHNGNDALTLARQEDFAAAVVDYQLPDMDGLSVLRGLREL